MAEDRWSGLPVLVAEDHPVNQQVISRQLHLLGYEAEVHGDGAAALGAWRERGFSALVTDCHMPCMDGFQLTAAIRAEEAESGGHLPIIALTANALSGEDERCVAAGMDYYLAKPVDLARLKQALDYLLSRR
jgi:CheY-like chemotaxis protein